MSDGNVLKELYAPKIIAPRLQRVDAEWNSWGHVIPTGVDWRSALTREYWARNFEKFRSGDRVEIHSSDHRVQFQMMILAINPATDPVHLDAVFMPIFPADLALPALERQRVPRYQVTLADGQGSLFVVVDRQTGQSVRENPLSRDQANQLAGDLQRQLDATESEMLLDEFERSQRAAPAPAPAALHGEVRLGDYRLRQAGDEWAIVDCDGGRVVGGLPDREAAERVLAGLNAQAPEEEIVLAIALREARPRPKKRGRPRKSGARPAVVDNSPIAAAPSE